MYELGFIHSRLTRPPLASRALFVAACTLQGENSKISIVACDLWPGFILWGTPRPTTLTYHRFYQSQPSYRPQSIFWAAMSAG